MSLGRKQRIDNSVWLEAVATIEEAVSRAERHGVFHRAR